MRDPKRIKKVLKVLGDVWSQYPDLRLGQLLENVTIQAGRPGHCLFYLEDGDLILDLCEYTGHETRPKKNTDLVARPLWPYKSMEEIGKVIKNNLKTTKRKKRKSKKIKGSGYKFPECLDPSLDASGHFPKKR